MDVKINVVDNGYVISTEDRNASVFQENYDCETNYDLNTLLHLTYDIWGRLGYFGSKHDKERLHCVIKDQEGNEIERH